MTGGVSIAQDQSTHNTNAIASLKAISKRYRLFNRKSDGSKREQVAATERGRDPVAVSSNTDGDPTGQRVSTSMKGLIRTGRARAESDAIAQSKLHLAYMRESHHNLSPSSNSQSEDAFTPDLSVDAVRGLSLLCAGLARLAGAVP